MITVVGVRFKSAGKVYYFDPCDFELAEGSKVIVETARGLEYGVVTSEPCEVSENSIINPLKKVVRLANEDDIQKHKENMRRKESVLKTCQEKIDARSLEMKLIDVEFTFDNTKVIFYFTAEGRIDFRDLVKDLAGIFRMRIELRQVGVRDEAKMFGGVGNCGKGLCCHTWLTDFNPVSIKMAKQQGLSLNPTKISGVCGRLMCCLRYENEAYQYLKKGMPEIGEQIKTPDGMAIVVSTNLMREKVNARLIIKEDKDLPDEERLSSDVNVYKKSEIYRVERRKKGKKQQDDYDMSNLPDEVRNLMGD